MGGNIAARNSAEMKAHIETENPHPQYEKKPIVEVFTESGTWNKPPGSKVISIILIAGGGGGNAGSSGSVAPSKGGWGGEGGSVFMGTFPADIFASSHAIIVGYGGLGSGNSSRYSGGASKIEGLFVAPPGSSYASSTGAMVSDTPAMFPGQQPNASNNTGVPVSSYNYESLTKMVLTGMPAGVSGAGIDSKGVAHQALMSGGLFVHGVGGFSFENRGYPSRALSDELNGLDATNYLNGTSGCGGAASLTGNGENGGHGGKYGCGGGGGGAAIAPFKGGRGGDGAPGIVIIMTHY